MGAKDNNFVEDRMFISYRVVSRDSHLCDVLRPFDAQRFVDLELDGKAVSVPAEPSLNVKSVLMHPSEKDFI
jgi:hypothetical protein